MMVTINTNESEALAMIETATSTAGLRELLSTPNARAALEHMEAANPDARQRIAAAVLARRLPAHSSGPCCAACTIADEAIARDAARAHEETS